MISKDLDNYISSCILDFDQIPDERKALLNDLNAFVKKQNTASIINLTFICTHNSRRSHLSQVWAQVAAHYYGFNNVYCYSGGTEATAMFYSVVNALTAAGLEVGKLSDVDNPIYSIKYAENNPPVICFSKKFNHLFNPQSAYAAVMTCNDADQNCPFIPNATRVSLPYIDPKEFDGKENQEEKYQERSRQIATELLYMFSTIKNG